jgi:hydrogenase nickel incorporation protein HypA/HybF
VHELGIAQDLLRCALEAAQAHGGLRVTRLRVRVGAMAAVSRDSLAFAFQVLSERTSAAGAALEVTETPPGWACPSCGRIEVAPAAACPTCGRGPLRSRSGHEVILESVEMEDAPAEVSHG